MESGSKIVHRKKEEQPSARFLWIRTFALSVLALPEVDSFNNWINPILLRLTSLFVFLRVDEQEEIEGLDLRSHGEKGYHTD